MITVETVGQIRQLAKDWHRSGQTVGLVPTMGYLHEGHLSLIRECTRLADRVVVSIFVNPTQFGPNEDFSSYPRNMERDLALCAAAGVHAVFAPQTENFYPPHPTTWVVEEELAKGLCGRSRPGHFRGVTTVVAKLFNAVMPDVAVFGQKDAQQALVVSRMVRDLDFPVKIHIAPIVREADGLAMSSRNVRLSSEQRTTALALNRGLRLAEKLCREGDRSAASLRQAVVDLLERAGAEIDYVELTDCETLQPVDVVKRPTLLALAVRVGKVRLIDNCIVDGAANGGL